MTDINIYEYWIGKEICKKSGKPFKSGKKYNTVTGIVAHPILNIPAFTFSDDDSHVECRKCKPVDENEDIIIVDDGVMFNGTREQFRDCFFSNANDAQIKDWCFDNGWSLSINGENIFPKKTKQIK